MLQLDINIRIKVWRATRENISTKSNHSIWLNPFATSLALRSTSSVSNDSSFFINIHLQPISFLPCSTFTSSYLYFVLVKRLISDLFTHYNKSLHWLITTNILFICCMLKWLALISYIQCITCQLFNTIIFTFHLLNQPHVCW